MFIDASALVALLSGEREAGRIASDRRGAGAGNVTGRRAGGCARPGRPDKFDRSVAAIESLVRDFLDDRDSEVRDLPPPPDTTRLALSAAHLYRSGRRGLNLGDCLHYACAKYHCVPILATDGEFGQIDLETIA